MDVILPPRTLPSDESKFYLFNCYSRWAQDVEEMANQLPSIKAEEMWQEKAYLFVRAALKLRNRSKILEGLLSWLFFNSMDCSLPLNSVLCPLNSPGKNVGVGSVQFSSVAQFCPTLCDPMDCNTPGFPVHHQLKELAQTHVYRAGDAI